MTYIRVLCSISGIAQCRLLSTFLSTHLFQIVWSATCVVDVEGPYAVPAYGSEWYSRNMYVNGSDVNKHHVATWGLDFGYKDFIPLFTAEDFDADAWAELYQRAGKDHKIARGAGVHKKSKCG